MFDGGFAVGYAAGGGCCPPPTRSTTSTAQKCYTTGAEMAIREATAGIPAFQTCSKGSRLIVGESDVFKVPGNLPLGMTGVVPPPTPCLGNYTKAPIGSYNVNEPQQLKAATLRFSPTDYMVYEVTANDTSSDSSSACRQFYKGVTFTFPPSVTSAIFFSQVVLRTRMAAAGELEPPKPAYLTSTNSPLSSIYRFCQRLQTEALQFTSVTGVPTAPKTTADNALASLPGLPWTDPNLWARIGLGCEDASILGRAVPASSDRFQSWTVNIDFEKPLIGGLLCFWVICEVNGSVTSQNIPISSWMQCAEDGPKCVLPQGIKEICAKISGPSWAGTAKWETPSGVKTRCANTTRKTKSKASKSVKGASKKLKKVTKEARLAAAETKKLKKAARKAKKELAGAKKKKKKKSKTT